MHKLLEEIFFQAVKYVAMIEPFLPTVLIFVIAFASRQWVKNVFWKGVIAAIIVPWLVFKFHETYVNPVWIYLIALICWSIGWLLAVDFKSAGTDKATIRAWITNNSQYVKAFLVVIFIVLIAFVHFVWPPLIWDHVNLALKWKHQAQFAGIYVALEKGYFTDRAIKVKLLEGGPDREQDPFVLVGRGDAHFGIGDPITLISERSEANPIKAIAVIFQKSPACWFLRKSKAPFRARDLIGKTVAVSSGRTNIDMELDLWIRKNNLLKFVVTKNVSDFLQLSKTDKQIYKGVIVEVPLRRTGLDSLGHFLTGNIDIWTGYTSNEYRTAQRLSKEPIVAIQSDPPVYWDLLFTTDGFLKNKKELVGRFMDAFKRGWEDAINPRVETSVLADIMSHVGDQGPENKLHQLEMLRSLRDNNIGNPNTFGSMTEASWDALLKDLKKFRLISGTVDVRIFFDSTFVE